MKYLDFQFHGEVVGFFEEPVYPKQDGEYRYEPYRGPGHRKMGEEIRENGSARCEYVGPDGRVSFEVRRSENGVLQMSSFRGEQPT